MVFTYRNLDGRGWQALGDALALSGIRPTRAWPMFGDGGANMHRHANSISWDCVLHCRFAQRPISRLDADPDAGDAFAEFWRERLAEWGHTLNPGDTANLRHAGRVLASFEGQASNGAARATASTDFGDHEGA